MQNPFLFPGTPQKFMGTEVFPLDPDTAKRVRFIPLYQLVYWLDKHASADDAGLSCWELLCLAEHHIRAGHLKAYAPSLKFSHKSSSGIEECIWDGEVHEVEVTHIGGFEVEEQWHNPLLDIFEYTEWLREVKPGCLKLPDNWPVPGVDQASISAPQAVPPASIKAAVEFSFFAKQRNGYTDLCEDLAHLLYSELGKNATATQAWARLQSRPPHGYEIIWWPKDARREMTLQGQKPVTFDQFKRFWNRWVFPADSAD